MTIRINCKHCKASLTYDDEKAGKKVRCKKCDELITLPAASGKKSRDEETAIQDKKRLKVKARARDYDDDEDDEDDDDEDDRPSKKGKKKNSSAMTLAIAGLAVGLVLFLGGGGTAAFFMFRSPKPVNIPIAKNDNRDDIQTNEIKPVAKPGPEKKQPDKAPKSKIDTSKPLPDTMSQEARERVKAAAAYIRVALPGGQGASGSGFMAVESGLVVTNAHVVGMLARNAQPPKAVEVIFNSGQPNELKLPAKIIGVDRFSDLAFLRVDGPNLPAPLQIDAERKPFETQPIHTFGFPLGEGLGKEITIGGGKVSSIRKGQLQLEANLQPGNSGGPVVNTAGDVIGVAVAIIKGTGLNFAVPAKILVMAMEGHATDTRLGQAYIDNGQLKLPVKLNCVDPLKKIGQVKFDIWTGMPGPTRSYSQQQPQPQAGDGPRQTHAATYQGGTAAADVPISQPNAGQVLWVQAIVTNAAGTFWAPAVATPMELYAIERKPANLTASFEQKLRTVKFKSSEGNFGTKNDETKTLGAAKFNVEMLEELVPAPDKMRIRTSYGKSDFGVEVPGKTVNLSANAITLLKQLPPGYAVDKTNKFLERPPLRFKGKVDASTRMDVMILHEQLYGSLEAATIPMPNRTAQPLESWQVKIPYVEPLLLDLKATPESIDLVVKCTYQGTRTRDGRTEAVITLSGSGQRRGKNGGYAGAEYTGRIGFDVNGGFVSFANVKVSYDRGIGKDGYDISFSNIIDLERQAGNPLNIPMPKDQPAAIIAKGKKWIDSDFVLAGPPTQVAIVPSPNPMLKQSPAFFSRMKMTAGKTYVITLDSNEFDAYLMIKDGTGQVIAEDDDGGATPEAPLNARIEFRCTQTGFYQVFATSFDGKGGKCHFRVQEAK